MRGILICLLLLIGTGVGAQEKTLFLKKSPFSTVVVTAQDHYRILKFRESAGDLEESRCDHRQPWLLLHEYLRLQLLALAFPPKVESILVVGMGGGTLSNQLTRAFPAAVVDSIELDPVVVEAARKYFDIRENEHHRVFVEDARAFLVRSHQRYDVIFLDAFDGLEIPESLRTQEFYQLVKAHLRPGGAAVTNLHLRSKLYAHDRNTLASVFSASYTFPTMAQVVVVATDEKVTPEGILEKVKALQSSLRLPYHLEKMALSLRQGQDWDLQAPVLHDSHVPGGANAPPPGPPTPVPGGANAPPPGPPTTTNPTNGRKPAPR